jgi:hypothetical protein
MNGLADPAGAQPGERPEDEDAADVDPLGEEFHGLIDDIERAARTDTDYDGPNWPF